MFLLGQHACADHAGVGATLRERDGEPLEAGGQRARAAPPRSRSRGTGRAEAPSPPPMTMCSGSKMFTKLAMPTPSQRPRSSSSGAARRRRRRATAATSSLAAASSAGAARRARERRARAVGLEAAAVRALARALRHRPPRRPCGRARRRGRSRRGRSRPSMITPPPTPVPSVSISRCRAGRALDQLGLGQRGAVGVVVDEDRDAEAPLELVAQRHALERDVHARDDRAGGEVDLRGHADADRRRFAIAARSRLRASASMPSSSASVLRAAWEPAAARARGRRRPRRSRPWSRRRRCPRTCIRGGTYPAKPCMPNCLIENTCVDRRLAQRNLRTALIAGAIALILFGASFLAAADLPRLMAEIEHDPTLAPPAEAIHLPEPSYLPVVAGARRDGHARGRS